MNHKVKDTSELRRIINTKYPRDEKLDDPMEDPKFKTLPLNKLDVSNVKDMSYLFKNIHEFNEDISDWDVSNVENMDGMFYNCYIFNQEIGSWNMGNVQTIELMFYNAKSFNKNINEWNVGNVEDMSYAFYGACSFNQPLDKWNPANVFEMREMFSECTDFNQNLTSWKLKEGIFIDHVFHNCRSLDFKNLKNLYKYCSNMIFENCFDEDFVRERDKEQLIALFDIFGEIDDFERNAYQVADKEKLFGIARRRYCSKKTT